MRIGRVELGVAVLLAVLAAASLAGSSSGATAKATPKITVGFLQILGASPSAQRNETQFKRAAKALGWRKLITYTLPEEGGASLRASGWKCLGEAGGGSWSRKTRPRVDRAPMQVKMKWEAA